MLGISILDDWEMLGIGQKNAGIEGPLTCGHPVYRSAVGACVRRLDRQCAKLNRTTSRALTHISKTGLQSKIG